MVYYLYCVFFFFKQKTAYEMRISDWSSDVCSSDLQPPQLAHRRIRRPALVEVDVVQGLGQLREQPLHLGVAGRRVGVPALPVPVRCRRGGVRVEQRPPPLVGPPQYRSAQVQRAVIRVGRDMRSETRGVGKGYVTTCNSL